MSFLKKNKPNGRIEDKQDSGQCDQVSIGNILTSTGVITHEQLLEALQYQLDNQDELLGEILIKLGFISQEDYDTARMKQRVMKNGFGKREMRVCFSMAKKRSESVTKAHDDLRTAALQLVNKLKVEEG